MKRVSFVAALLCLLAFVSGCGGSSHKTTPPQKSSPTRTVRVCSGLTDKCVQRTLPPTFKLARPLTLTSGTGCHIVDISDYQGTPNWTTVAPYICGAVIKGGEGASTTAGGQHFVTNWNGAKAAGRWHAMYWFMRGSVSCATQGTLIVARLNAVGFKTDQLAGPPQLDEEVPGANVGNLAVCVDGIIYRAFHVHAGIYTAPGTWPGGSHGVSPLWQAEYGSILHAFWSPVVAWQCTDGVYGCVTSIPGLGYQDVSKNYGLISEVVVPPKPPTDPYAAYPAGPVSIHNQKVSERSTVVAWWKNHCRNPVRRPVCKSTRLHLVWLHDRLHTIALLASPSAPPTAPVWSAGPKGQTYGVRYFRIGRILASK